jgi:hypothetical protein
MNSKISLKLQQDVEKTPPSGTAIFEPGGAYGYASLAPDAGSIAA